MEIRTGKLSELRTVIGDREIDVFLCSASFEERCLSVASRLERKRVTTAVISHSVSHLSAVQHNLAQMEALFEGSCRDIQYFADDPLQSVGSMIGTLGGLFDGPPRRLLMDITTFTREALLMILRLLRDLMRRCDSLELVYVQAREYSWDKEGEKKWLSRGITEVRSVLGYPGNMRPSWPTHMVVMVGFEFERALEIVRVCEPSSVSLGVADARQAGTANHQSINERIVERLASVVPEVGTFTFRAYDPVAAREDLTVRIAKFVGYNVLVAPMHTKISTVGAALLAFNRADVQLCYAPAKIYNVEKYSVEGDVYYWFRIAGGSWRGW